MKEYIDKSALVAEIERRIKRFREEKDSVSIVKTNAYKGLLSFLETLEVKEVDLDEEIEKCLKKHNMLAVGKKDFTNIAKHFFELGMTVSNKV